MDLQDGLVTRPLTPQDAPAVAAVMADAQRVDVGTVLVDEADIVSDWARPSFDVATQVIGVYDGERLVAYAEYSGGDRSDGAVVPSYRGRGIGTQLCAWIRATAAAHGAATIGSTVPQGGDGERLFRDLGYRVRWESWVFELPPGARIEPTRLPEGYRVGEAAPHQHQDIWRVNEDAFLEWAVRERRSYADWTAVVTRRPGFEPWNLRVAVDGGGRVVGMAYVLLTQNETSESYVELLAVHRDHRHRGLARALLADAYECARAHGAQRGELSTDSRTGAKSLYESLGMRVASTWVSYATAL